jgi:hypothetical protein
VTGRRAGRLASAEPELDPDLEPDIDTETDPDPDLETDLGCGRAQRLCEWGNRGREAGVWSGPPPSEPDRRFSRIRLSSQWAPFRG